jgi:hypothetical protein
MDYSLQGYFEHAKCKVEFNTLPTKRLLSFLKVFRNKMGSFTNMYACDTCGTLLWSKQDVENGLPQEHARVCKLFEEHFNNLKAELATRENVKRIYKHKRNKKRS